ncbi:CoA-binding protein, partial [bacterium]|nr:CoA-binding protein [bacterium]
VIRCNDIEEMFNRATAMAYQPYPRGNRVAIVTNAGGPGVLATDAAIQQGLQLARFAVDTTKVLQKNLPKTANIKNPVDVIGDAHSDRYHAALVAVLQDEEVDGVFVILTPQSMTDIEAIAEEVCRCSEQFEKPIYASFMGETDVAAGIDILQRHKIPHYILPESMCGAFHAAWDFKTQTKELDPPLPPLPGVERESVARILRHAADKGDAYLGGLEAFDVLKAYGFAVGGYGMVASKEEAASLASRIGFPVVMKVVSRDIVHKVDVGGVILDIASAKEAEEAYAAIMAAVSQNMPEAQVDGVFVQEMCREGDEVILGVKRDPSFGAVILFGMGGIFVEIYKDISFRVAPLSKKNMQTMMAEIKGYPLLTGARGQAKRDIAAIQDCLHRLSQLALDFPQIKELDINPLMVRKEAEGVLVADTKIMLKAEK